MRFDTRSETVRDAVTTALRIMPPAARQVVQAFITRLGGSTEYHMFGLSGELDPASAKLLPLYGNLHDLDHYEAQIDVTLPIFRLFSRKAQVGIIAHEFAHAKRASERGTGWHEKMQSRYDAEEKAADRLATSWGFGSQISAMRRERDQIVNPLLDARLTQIMRRMHRNYQAQRQAFMARQAAKPKGE